MKDWFDTEWLQDVWDNTVGAIKFVLQLIFGGSLIIILYYLLYVVGSEVFEMLAYILRPIGEFLDYIFFE